jgi:TolA-binding protein
LSLQVGLDFEQVLHMQPGDDLIAARFARNLEGKVAQLGARPRPSRRRSAWIAAVLIALGASAGLAAARLGAWPFVASQRTAVPADRAEARPAARKRPVRLSVQQPVEPVEPVAAPIAEPMAGAREPDRSAAAARAPGAAELFAQANALRRAGESKRARALYRQLQQRYPRSPEVPVSHVSLGRVQLELGEARDALAQFERYLSKLPRGALAEEALFGKASALQRLGRHDEERRTWQALLAAYPGSVYAERARQRLEPAP